MQKNIQQLGPRCPQEVPGSSKLGPRAPKWSPKSTKNRWKFKLWKRVTKNWKKVVFFDLWDPARWGSRCSGSSIQHFTGCSKKVQKIIEKCSQNRPKIDEQIDHKNDKKNKVEKSTQILTKSSPDVAEVVRKWSPGRPKGSQNRVQNRWNFDENWGWGWTWPI